MKQTYKCPNGHPLQLSDEEIFDKIIRCPVCAEIVIDNRRPPAPPQDETEEETDLLGGLISGASLLTESLGSQDYTSPAPDTSSSFDSGGGDFGGAGSGSDY